MSTSAKSWLDAVGSHFGILDWKLSSVRMSSEAAIISVHAGIMPKEISLAKKKQRILFKSRVGKNVGRVEVTKTSARVCAPRRWVSCCVTGQSTPMTLPNWSLTHHHLLPITYGGLTAWCSAPSFSVRYMMTVGQIPVLLPAFGVLTGGRVRIESPCACESLPTRLGAPCL